MAHRDVFFNYLVIFPETLQLICENGSRLCGELLGGGGEGGRGGGGGERDRDGDREKDFIT